MRSRLFLTGLVLASNLCLSAAAEAQDTRDPAGAEALFRQGRTAAEKNDFQTACAKFRESNRLDPAVGTVFNIADCEEKLGHLATSWTLFQEVVQRLANSDERRGIAEQRAARLEPRVPKLSIHLASSARTDIVVRRDGVSLGNASLDTPLPVDPGDHTVIVEAPGTKPAEFHAHLAEGDKTTINVAPGEVLPASEQALPNSNAQEHPQTKTNHTAAYVVGGIGIAGLVTGAIAGVLVLNKKSTVNSECVGKACSQAGLDAANSGKTLGVVTTVGLVTGAVGLGAATYLFVSAPAPGESTRSSAYLVGLRTKW
ncbi:MAG TPA: hypothetical protein VGM44_09030 [Polyangiaceae bacterium]